MAGFAGTCPIRCRAYWPTLRLLQVFLNLTQNSHRAVQQGEQRELKISAALDRKRLLVRFQDSGPGVPDPQALFNPFQPGAASTGLGLYVSRALLRNYGGDLRYEAGGRRRRVFYRGNTGAGEE